MNTPSLQFLILALLISTISGPSYAEEDEDAPGIIRSYTFDTTMDKAGDASRQAELALESSLGPLEACKGADVTTAAADPEASEKCELAKAERKKFLEETKGIRKTQRIFAHASRASDVAAVGAIGAVGYQELMKKDATQADNLRSVAKVQETAGYVAYTAGAADFAMGAYSFAAHKNRLEKMSELVKKINPSGLTAEDQNVVSKLTTAAEASKKAAYNHMLYGAGKAAVGYGSMHLAKQNRKIADSLTSLEIPMQYGYAATPTVSSNRNPNAPVLINNRPEFFVPNSSTTSSLQGDPTTGGGATVGFGGGASVMSPEGSRTPSSGGGGSLGGGSPSAAGGGGGGGSGASSGEDSAAGGEEAVAAPKDPFGSNFEVNLMGGGGMGYRGGESSSGSSGDSAPIDAITDASNTASNATGLNPGSIYDEATEDLSGEEQGSMAGISSGNSSLFQVVRAKYLKMSEGGRVQGPGDVEVKSQ